jgi:hypothetical protein
MATYNIGASGASAPNIPWLGNARVNVVEIDVDLSRRTGYQVPTAGYAASDVLQLVSFPAGSYLMYAGYEVIVGEGSAATITLATVGTALALITGGTSIQNATTVVTAMNVTSGLMTANSVLTLTLAGTLTGGGTAKLCFKMVIADMRHSASGPL